MRRVKIFSGSSHPVLVEAICERLGTSPANCKLTKFSNGETSVSIDTSIRNQDVFIVQSGSSKINDSVMELLIMISACKGGSAKSITGFFGQPVDNLHAEPLIARWIRAHVTGWKAAVVVSKNPGGTKRVTSLADALKLNFGMVTTDRRRTNGNAMLENSGFLGGFTDGAFDSDHVDPAERAAESQADPINSVEDASPQQSQSRLQVQMNRPPSPTLSHPHQTSTVHTPSRLVQSIRVDSASPPRSHPRNSDTATIASPSGLGLSGSVLEEYTDERAREVITGRLIQGHIVDDDFPSPILSTMSNSLATLPENVLGPAPLESSGQDPMASSIISNLSTFPSDHALGGTVDAKAEDDDDEEGLKNPELEHTITLVGNVKDRVVLIIDDMIDQCGSWIAAAETVIKRGSAKKVYCIATHGLFGDDSLEKMEECECIDFIVVTNSYPIEPSRVRMSKKLVVLDISNLLSEAIRRNHYGESISALFQHYQD
ncbi:MAG: hypothetical protein Q9191_001461 [Dirinaria sp. TL-2023a]